MALPETEAAPAVPAVAVTRASRLGLRYFPQLLAMFQHSISLSTGDVAAALGVAHRAARGYLSNLAQLGLLRHEAKSKTDPQARWVALHSGDWSEWTTYLLPDQPTAPAG